MSTTHAERGGLGGVDRERESEQASTVQLDAPLRQLMAKGPPSVPEVVVVMQKYPMQRIAMMQTLQRELGNAFAQQVTAEMQQQHAEPNASFAHLGGPKPAVNMFTLSKDAGLAGLIANASMYQGHAEQQLTQITGVLPGYVKARNALDREGVHQIGMVVLASLELLRAAVSGMGDQLGKYDAPAAQQCAPGSDPQADLTAMQQVTQIEGLQEKRKQIALAATNIQHQVLQAMTPREHRGVLLSGMLLPVAGVDNAGGTDVRGQVAEELGRTLRVIVFAEQMFIQFAQPGALQDASKTFQARQLIGEFAHRPADLAFLRSVLMSAGLWQALNKDDGPSALGGMPKKEKSPFGMEVCTDDGPLTSLWAETKKQAEETGWLTDIGHYDRHQADMEIRIGSTEGVLIVYQQIMSAPQDGRAQILYSLQRKGQLEPFLEKLPWKYTKDIHDGLPSGHGDIKSALQRHFLVEGRWGTSLENQEYHAPSLTKMIRGLGDDVGGIGEDIIDGFDSALNFVTFGFHHSYGEARDLHSQGMITDDDYATALRQISTRTAVGMAIMMATAGYGRAAALGSGSAPPMMGAMALNRGVAGTALAAGVEGGTFATAEMFALDTTDMITGAKSQYSDVTDYLKVAMLGGGMGAMVGGTTSWLTSRTAAQYLPSNMLTKGQSLAVEHPGLAPVLDQLQGVGRGTTVELRITASQADDLAKAGVIDSASHKALRDALGNNAEINAVIEVVDDLNMPMSATATGGAGGAGGAGKPPAPSPSLTVKSATPATTTTKTAGTAANSSFINARAASAASEAGLDVGRLTEAQRRLLDASDQAIARGDLHEAARVGDELVASGLPKNSVSLFEDAISKATGKTSPEVYRNPVAKLPNGSTTAPSAYGGDLYYGTDSIPPEVAFEQGLAGRGTNTSLLDHVHQNPDSAFRGTTRTIFTQDRDGGAGYWAGEGGWVYKIDGTPSWDLNAKLDGRVPRPDGSYGGNPLPGEHEQAVLANIPRERIAGAMKMIERNGNLVPGPFIPNPHYKPAK